MKPVDPRLLRHARHSRAGIALLALIGIGQALATVTIAVGLTFVLAAPASSSRPLAVVLLAAAFAARALLAWAEQVVAHRTAARVGDELRRSLVQALARRGPAWVAGFGSGRLTALLTSGLESLRPWFAGYLPAVILGAALPPLVLLAIFWVDPASALIALVTLPLIPLLGALIGWATQARATERWQADARLAGHFLDVVRGLATLRTFGRATRQTAVIEDLTDRHRSATLRVLRVAFLSSTALDLVGTLSVGLIAVSTGLRVAAGHLALAPALLIILLAPEVYRPLREMAARYHAATDATAVIADVDEVLTDLPPALPSGDRAGLAASGLRVRHAGALRDALALPELVVGAGEIVALTGPSGAGKTTALRALAGLQPVNAGTVTLDGEPVYVPQSPSLPHARTVADLFPEDTPAAEIESALQAVGLGVSPQFAARPQSAADDLISAGGAGHGWIAHTAGAPGMNDLITATTALGEHGTGVSAGQRHRLALAAALYRGPATLLLDEPTAHLDPETEQLVIARLRQAAAAGSAILVAAHRPALIAAADRVVPISSPQVAPAKHAVTTSTPQVAPAEQAVDVSPHELASASLTAPASASQNATPSPAGQSATTNEPAPTRTSEESAPAGTRERWRRPWVAVALGSASALSGLVLTGAAAWLLVRASALPPVLTLSAAVVLVRGSAVARPLLRYLERLVSHDLAFARLGKRRAKIYEALIPRIPGGWPHRRGELLTKVVDDVDAQVDGLLRGRLPAAAAWVTLAIGAGVATIVVPALALPVGVGLFVAGVVAPALAARQARRQEAATSGARARLRDAMVETVGGIEELRLVKLLRVPDRRSRELAAREAQAARSAGVAGALAHGGWGVAVVGAAFVLGHAGISHEWTGVLLLGLVVLGESALGLPEAAVARVRAAAAEERLAALPAAALSKKTPTTEGPVMIRGLVAGWGEHPALAGLDLDLPKGSRTAITGRSGAGKTTLGMVLAGFLGPRAGTVTLGGHHKVILVGDETGHVFASTVRENLRLAKPTASDDELAEVLRRVRLDDWLAGTPHGLGTWLGTGGSTISGGQARRLATARALLADPDLLILDEPTEGLDEPTAKALMTDLLDAADGRTLLVLTHRREGLERTAVLTLS